VTVTFWLAIIKDSSRCPRDPIESRDPIEYCIDAIGDRTAVGQLTQGDGEPTIAEWGYTPSRRLHVGPNRCGTSRPV
jgi:hypothetical protein